MGSLVTPGQSLITLTQTDATEVAARVSSAQLAALQHASGIQFVVPGAATTNLTLMRAGSVLDPDTRLHSVRLVAAESATATPGQAGRLQFRSGQMFLPAAYIQRRASGLGVFIVSASASDTARFVLIDGAQEGRPAQVALAADAQVIDGGREKLNDGDRIAIAGE